MLANDYLEKVRVTESVLPQDHKADLAALKAVFGAVASLAGAVDLIKKHIFYGQKEISRAQICGSFSYAVAACQNAAEVVSSPSLGVQTDVSWRTLHGIIGVITEAGEMAEAGHAALLAGQLTDEMRLNLLEESGDGPGWYNTILLDSIGFTRDDADEANIRKLRKRHGDKFDAIAVRMENRNIEAETRALEEAVGRIGGQGFPEYGIADKYVKAVHTLSDNYSGTQQTGKPGDPIPVCNIPHHFGRMQSDIQGKKETIDQLRKETEKLKKQIRVLEAESKDLRESNGELIVDLQSARLNVSASAAKQRRMMEHVRGAESANTKRKSQLTQQEEDQQSLKMIVNAARNLLHHLEQSFAITVTSGSEAAENWAIAEQEYVSRFTKPQYTPAEMQAKERQMEMSKALWEGGQ